jgi:2-keto-4-pentenoate hydratase/2-oxohepta-3-ene-1,7-dioic acid hydratase in catechol pathway
MLAYASRGTRLRRGALIGSRTVGNGCLLEKYGLDPEGAWLRAGDPIENEIERFGAISTRITEPAPVVPLRPAASARSGS